MQQLSQLTKVGNSDNERKSPSGTDFATQYSQLMSALSERAALRTLEVSFNSEIKELRVSCVRQKGVGMLAGLTFCEILRYQTLDPDQKALTKLKVFSLVKQRILFCAFLRTDKSTCDVFEVPEENQAEFRALTEFIKAPTKEFICILKLSRTLINISRSVHRFMAMSGLLSAILQQGLLHAKEYEWEQGRNLRIEHSLNPINYCMTNVQLKGKICHEDCFKDGFKFEVSSEKSATHKVDVTLGFNYEKAAAVASKAGRGDAPGMELAIEALNSMNWEKATIDQPNDVSNSRFTYLNSDYWKTVRYSSNVGEHLISLAKKSTCNRVFINQIGNKPANNNCQIF